MSAVTLTPAETLSLVNDGFTSPEAVERGGLVQLARALVEGAVGDLNVFCQATSVEGVDGQDLGMALIRVRERLEAAASMLHRHIHPRCDGNDAEPTETEQES